MKKVILITLILFLASCATKERKPEHAKPPPNSRTPPVEMNVEGIETPERTASDALIDEGQGPLKRGLYDSSADFFQQAVAVDPSNGAGYYYLSLTKLRGGEYGEAEGLLEKAEVLLSNDSTWAYRLKQLRSEFEEKKPR